MRTAVVPVEEIFALRWAVLRTGLPREAAVYPEDARDDIFHIAAYDDAGAVRGCVTFFPDPMPGEAAPAYRFRGMGSAPEVRGQGYGVACLFAGLRESAERGASSCGATGGRPRPVSTSGSASPSSARSSNWRRAGPTSSLSQSPWIAEGAPPCGSPGLSVRWVGRSPGPLRPYPDEGAVSGARATGHRPVVRILAVRGWACGPRAPPSWLVAQFPAPLKNRAPPRARAPHTRKNRGAALREGTRLPGEGGAVLRKGTPLPGDA